MPRMQDHVSDEYQDETDTRDDDEKFDEQLAKALQVALPPTEPAELASMEQEDANVYLVELKRPRDNVCLQVRGPYQVQDIKDEVSRQKQIKKPRRKTFTCCEKQMQKNFTLEIKAFT